MAEKKGTRKYPNYVQIDGVFKEQETFNSKVRCRNKWIDYDINKICLEVARDEGYDEREFKQMLNSNKKPQYKPMEDDWTLYPSEGFPKTSAGEVGWRHRKSYHNLELYGPLYRSPKLTMVPLFEPAEVIFLG